MSEAVLSPERAARPAVLVLEDDPAYLEIISETLGAAGYDVRPAATLASARAALAEESPAAAVLDWRLPDGEGVALVAEVRADPKTSGVGVLLLSALTSPSERVAGLELGADDYLTKPFDSDELVARVGALIRRTERDGGRSPLTGLPGNERIRREVERRLRTKRAFDAVYLDIDDFKPFNDRHGFARGDEAILCLAACAGEALAPGEFLGHIGGDDFVALAGTGRGEAFARLAVEDFAGRARNLHDEADGARGRYESMNRKGERETFSLLHATAAVVPTRLRRVSNYAEIAQAAAEVKEAARREGVAVRRERRTS